MELNAIPGIANRVLGSLADRIFRFVRTRQTLYFRADKVAVVGTRPLRRAFAAPPPSPGSGRIDTLLICGGSQGARSMNSPLCSKRYRPLSRIQSRLAVIHQSGANDFDRVAESYRHMNVNAEVVPFVEDMPGTLRRADLVICRCGGR